MVQIRVTPEELERVASSLDSQKETLVSTLDRVITEVHNLQGEWEGMAEKDYMRMFDDRVPPMKPKVQETLEEVAQRLRHAAETLREADQAAA